MNAVKLEDIAKMLDVSVSTVSRALSGKGRVGAKTRERVLQAVRDSDYTVNAVARSLRLRDAKNIGIIVPDITNSFFASVIKGAQLLCRENGYTLMVCNSDENAEYEEDALHMLLEKQVSGLILATVGGSAEPIRQYQRLNIPIVYIDNIPENREVRDQVSIDNLAAARLLTQKMIERGYRSVGMITGPRSQSTGLHRYNGFLQAVSEAGLQLRSAWVREGSFRMEDGYEEMRKILALKDYPRAMIFGNNYLAYGAMKAIREAGLDIPGDVAVASFDAQDDTGLINPRITSINQPTQDIGRQAAAMIFARLADENSVPRVRELLLEPSFVDGKSW